MRPTDPRRAWWGILLPLATALAALGGVLIVLIILGRETNQLRRSIAAVGDPAREQLFDLQRVLGLQMAAQRAYRLGAEPRSGEIYDRLVAREDSVLERLLPLAHALGPEATATLAEDQGSVGRWHGEVENLPADGLAAGRLEEPLSMERGPYARALAATERLGRIIDAAVEAKRSRLFRLERTEDALVTLLSVPAALSVLVLFGVGRRLHRLTLEERRLARVARQRQEELERAGREKERFMRGVTHDLKNPLGVMDGYAELLELGVKGPLTEDQLTLVARIRRAAADALQIIQDLLELARAEARGLPIDPEPVELTGLVRSTAEDYRGPAEAAGLALAFEQGDHVPELRTDPARVREVLGNLLGNAIKHTPSGGRIHVRVALRHVLPGDDPCAAIDVTDTGPGIPEGSEERIFEEFERGSASDGSGVGLAISRRIARVLGGDLVVDSTPGDGATFTLLLPVSRK